MKTTQVLTRKMGEFEVLQRTSDGMFNATTLLKAWNSHSGQQKKLDHYFENNSTDEFVSALLSEENLNTRNSVYLKSRGKYNGGTWMHPLLFIDFAMWLNPTFKVKVLRFVSDKLIEYRNEAGDSYKILSSAISKIVPKDEMPKAMSFIAKSINYVIYNSHERQLRNKKADELSLKNLCELQVDIAKFINFGFINSYDQLKNFLRKRWVDRWQPVHLLTEI